MKNSKKDTRLPFTSEAEEAELISLAFKQARQQLKDGTAPASTVNFFLKLGSSREKLEKDELIKKKELLEAKVESLKASKAEVAEYERLVETLKSYSSSIN